MTAGRPLAYDDPDKLRTDIDDYFANEPKPTLAGLAYSLGISRSTLYEYDNKEQFSDIIKKARERVESIYEERLLYSNNTTGVIFALKNMSWRDRRDLDHTSDGKPIKTNTIVLTDFKGETTNQ